MLISLLLLFLIACGGVALTYLITDDEPLLWRFAAGNVIGSAVFGTACFLLAMAFGFQPLVIVVGLALTLVPMGLLRGKRRSVLIHDWAKSKGKLQGANLTKALNFAYYAFFLILFVAFFDRAYFANDQGIFTGGSNNLGDLPFHLGIIYSFVDGANFLPQNPSFAGAKLSYPFIPDLITAAFMKLGVGVREAMLVQNVSWAFALLVILESFVFRIVSDRYAARIAPALLFLSGGLGFLWFFSDFGAQAKGFADFLFSLPKDYTIGDEFRWGNSLVTLFLTQRSLLLGMPLTLAVLGFLWKIFTAEATETAEEKGLSPSLLHSSTPLLLGAIAGMLPLIHLHSLFVLFVVAGFLFLFRPAKWREWLLFGLGVCLIAVPQLIWSITGSASNAAEFFQIHIGWDAGQTNLIWFWIKNTGLAIPMIAAGFYLLFRHSEPAKKENAELSKASLTVQFYMPFLFVFILANIAKLAPWQWDNIKVLIYWFVGSLPFIAFALAWLWRKSKSARIAAIACFVALIFAGGLDVWRTVSRQINYKVFDADAVTLATRVNAAIPPQAFIVNAPTYNTATVLTGRSSLLRYPGHLASHGISFGERERDVKLMYLGGPGALGLFEKYDVKYVLVSPEERNTLSPNEAFFRQFPIAGSAGQYTLYDVRKPGSK